MNLQEALERAKRNKKNRIQEPDYRIIENDKEYPAVILDASLSDKQDAVDVEFLVYNTADGTSQKRRFWLNGAREYFFQQFCEVLGVNSYKELPGKMLSLHFVQNGDFQNVHADVELLEEDIEDHIRNLKPVKKNKLAKKAGNKGTRKKDVQKKEYQKPLDDGFPDDDFLPEDDE